MKRSHEKQSIAVENAPDGQRPRKSSKGKGAPNQTTNDKTSLCLSIPQQDIDHEDIESHPDYKREMDLILSVQRRRELEAERNRKYQIKNINDLYAFEIENIEASAKLACEEVKAQIFETLQQQAESEEQKCPQENARVAASQLDDETDRRRTRSLSIASDPGVSLPNKESESKSNGEVFEPKGYKSLSPPVVDGMPSILMNRKQNNKKTKVFGEDILQNHLSEPDARSDLLQIVRHLEDRAVGMLESSTESLGPTVEASVVDGALSITLPSLDGRPSTPGRYRTGSLVLVRSSTSAEDLSGTLTVISEDKDDVIVRMHTGPRLRVPLSQVRCGRISIGRDVSAYRDMALIMAARSGSADLSKLKGAVESSS